MISAPLDEIANRARKLSDAIGEQATIVDGRSMIGGGSLPDEGLPTKLIALKTEGASPDQLARRLRQNEPPVIARIEHDDVLLDPRTVASRQHDDLAAAVRAALG